MRWVVNMPKVFEGKKGAYFFVLDAFIAGLVIIATLAVSLSSASIQDNPVQSSLLVEDFLSYLEQTTLAEYGGEMVYTMISNGFVTDTSYTLLEQAVFLESIGTTQALGNLSALLAEVSALAPEQVGIGYYLTDGADTTELYAQTISSVTQDSARLLLSAKRIIIARGETQVVVMEVRAWQ